MSKKTEEKVVFQTEDARGIILAWVNASKQPNNPDTPPSEYLTKEGMSFLNGYLQASNTMNLIKQEEYNKLLDNYEILIQDYEDAQKDIVELNNKVHGLRMMLNKSKRSWRSFITNIYK